MIVEDEIIFTISSPCINKKNSSFFSQIRTPCCFSRIEEKTSWGKMGLTSKKKTVEPLSRQMHVILEITLHQPIPHYKA